MQTRLSSAPSDELTTVGSALTECRGGWSRSRQHLVAAGSGRAYLKMNNITRRGRLDLSKLVYVEADAAAAERFGVRLGDVLFNSKNSGDLVLVPQAVRSAPQTSTAAAT